MIRGKSRGRTSAKDTCHRQKDKGEVRSAHFATVRDSLSVVSRKIARGRFNRRLDTDPVMSFASMYHVATADEIKSRVTQCLVRASAPRCTCAHTCAAQTRSLHVCIAHRISAHAVSIKSSSSLLVRYWMIIRLNAESISAIQLLPAQRERISRFVQLSRN